MTHTLHPRPMHRRARRVQADGHVPGAPLSRGPVPPRAAHPGPRARRVRARLTRRARGDTVRRMDTRDAVPYSLRLPAEISDGIDAERARMQALVPSVEITRTDAVVSLLTRALATKVKK